MKWKTSPLVIAHRGDTKAGVENTLSAVESAMRLGVDGIEVDLQITRDDKIVVFHDEDLQRIHGSPLTIRDSLLSEIRKAERKEAPLPTLEDLLDLVRDRVLLNLELKTLCYFEKRLEVKVAEILKSFSFPDALVISSFNMIALWRFHRMAPALKQGYLFQDKPWLHRVLIPVLNPYSINTPLSYVSQVLSERTHRAGRKFFVWTVNHENDMELCLKHGADGIITDEPAKLIALLQKNK